MCVSIPKTLYPVYTIQPVVNNRFDNRFYRVNGALDAEREEERIIVRQLAADGLVRCEALRSAYLYVCSLAYLGNHVSKFHDIFYACYL